MKNKKRRDVSRKRAEQYAPRPQSSVLMYGAVGVSLVVLALIALGRFYDVEPFEYPLWIGVMLLLAFAGSVVLRMVRSRRHAAAHSREYAKARSERH